MSGLETNDQVVYSKDKKVVQRALILSCGALAHDASERLQQQFVRTGSPLEAVAILPLKEKESPADITAALRQISQTSVKEKLARQGWQVDRLDEIALYAILDLGDASADCDPGRLVEEAANLAEQNLGAMTAALCLALLPTGAEDERSRLLALLAARASFTRGVLALGLTNEMGLCLPDADALVTQAAHILHTLTMTPLRDGPEWLSERQAPGRQDWATVASAGLAVWEWSPEWELKELARLWLRQILAAWLEDAPEEPATGAANRWLAAEELETDKLARRLSAGREQLLALPPPAYPQPWHLPRRYQPLCLLAEEIPEKLARELALAQAAVARQASASLQALAAQALDETPVGGIARLEKLLGQIRSRLSAWQERLLEQHERALEENEAWTAGFGPLASEMEAQLAGWPQPVWGDWLRLLAKPWRWPGLAWRYYQMGLLARQLAQAHNERRQWRWRCLTLDAADAVYRQIDEAATKIEEQAEEMGEMLRYIGAKVIGETGDCPPSLAGRPDYIAQRLARLADQPSLEAVWAAQLIGGLGRQLSALDDAFVDTLLAQGQRRLAGKGSFSAVAALSLLYPTDEALQSWWKQLWESAAPLWRYDQTEQGESGGAQAAGVALIGGADALRLQRLLNQTDSPEIRWLATADSNLTVLRLRQGRERVNGDKEIGRQEDKEIGRYG